MKHIFFILSITVFCFSAFGQSNENVLLTINNHEVDSEEFARIYNKNKDITPDDERKTVDEYLDLFINYKLKVIEAQNMGYDTAKSFVVEFSGYKNQLAKPYLQNSELKDSLIQEAYDRSKIEVHASHILIRVKEDALPKDTLKAFDKIMGIRARVTAGEPFSEVAKATSDDPSVKENGGDLGFFTVFRMIYQFETAAFNTPKGKISMPVRTREGYHIIKVHDVRKARGKVKVAHTMSRIPRNATAPEIQAAKDKIDAAYKELMEGAKWEDVVQKYSENPRTKQRNGEIGWLHTGQAPEEFLDACYELDINGFSKPIQTVGGFHIAYLLEKQEIESFEVAKEKISRRIDNDRLRKQALKDIMNSELSQKYGMTTNIENALALTAVFDSSVYNGKWNPDAATELTQDVVSFNSKSYTQHDLAQHLSSNRYSKSTQSYENIIHAALLDFSEKMLFDYAMEMLPVENSEYKYLLKEYHDGILLFNLTNDMVWQKAQDDSVGLEQFYKKADKYMWNERIEVIVYEYTDDKFTTSIPKIAKKQFKKNLGDEFIVESLCPNDSTPCVNSSRKIYEKGSDAIADKLTWTEHTTTLISDAEKNYLYYVVDVMSGEPKKLSEARGLYVADYQNYLETKWILELREKYTFNVNQDELSRIKSELN